MEKGRDQGMKKRKLLPVLLVLLLLLLAAGAALLFAGGGQDSGSGVDESVKPSPLLLQASQDRFRVYKGAQTELTVTSRELDAGTVTITDELGEVVLTLELENGMATGTIGVFEEEPRCIQLTASMGEAKSQPLNLYVAPEVTLDMIVNGYMVAEELGSYITEQGFTEIDENALTAAEAWLKVDDRVEAVITMDNGLFYYTTDGIAGACMPGPDEGTFGSTIFAQESNETLTTYQKWTSTGSLSDFQYLWSDNTLTNDRILVLRPQYYENLEGIWAWGAQFEDPCVHNEAQSDVAYDVANTMGWPEPEVLNDINAVSKLISGTINEYGIIMINTHGVMIGPEGTATEDKLFAFLLQKEFTLRSLDDDHKAYSEYLKEHLSISDGNYDRFFTKYTTDAEANMKTCQLYIQVADYQKSIDAEKANEEAGIEKPVETCVGLYGTANMLASLHQNAWFDNSVVYWGVCESMANLNMAQFLIDRGAAACVGYENEVDDKVEAQTCGTFFSDLTAYLKGESRTKNVEESCETIHATLAGRRTLTWAGRSLFNLIAPKDKELESDQYNMYAVADPADYTLKGTGTLSGTVQMDQTGEPVGGALVELYRWLDQEFVLMGTTSTTGKGTFKVEDIPRGVYVAKVTTEEGAPAYANCILATEKWDAGTILVEGMSPYYIYIRDELEPKLGLFELGEKSQEIYDFNAQGWDMRTGILSAAIQDMNADGTDDMVLLRVELEDRKGWNLQTLYADMYTLEKGKVVLKDSVKLDVFNNCEIHDTWAAMYETESGYDLFVQSYSESVLFSGNDPIYSRYRFDGEALRKVFSIEQTEGGTTEKVYSEMKYDEQTDQETTMALWRDEMLWGWDGPGLYNSWGYKDSLSMYWAYLEEKMAMKAPGDVYDYPSYAGADKFTSVAEFKNDGVPVGGMGGDFSMSVMDYTDLRGALEELEKQ